MSTFRTFSTDKKAFKSFIRNATTLNLILSIVYILMIVIFSRLNNYISISLLVLCICLLIVYEIYLKNLKTNGTLQLTKTNLSWLSENGRYKIENEDIEEIVIIKRALKSKLWKENIFVLFDIICKDKSTSQFIVRKYSKEKDEFDILESLRVFSTINKIKITG